MNKFQQKLRDLGYDQKLLSIAFAAVFGFMGGMYLLVTHAQSSNFSITGSNATTSSCQNSSGATYQGITVTCSDQVVFVSNRSGRYQIYEKNLLDGSVTSLTSGQSDNMNPEPSPDGSELVFYSNRSGTNQIYELNVAQPGQVTQLTHDTGGINNYDPVFSANGNSIYFRKTDNSGKFGDIWQMKADGSDPVDVTPSLIAQGIEGLKPTPVNSSLLVFTERTQPGTANAADSLYSLNLNTKTTTELTNNESSSWFPSYSSEASKLLFVKTPINGMDTIDSMNSDGSDGALVISKSGDNDDPSWVNGQSLLFINSSDGQYDVYLSSSSGNSIALVDRSPKGSNDFSPVMIP